MAAAKSNAPASAIAPRRTHYLRGPMALALPLASVMISGAFAQASAQPSGPPQGPPQTEGWQIRAGAGVLVAPHYRGDEDYRILPVPFVSATYGDRLSVDFPRGVRYQIDNEGAFQYGVGANIEPGRDEDDAGLLQGLGDVDLSAGPQAFASYRVGPVRVTADAFTDLADGHGGSRINLEVSARVLASRQWGIVTLSGGAELGDESYVSTLFGITPDQAAQSLAGLPDYSAGAGVTEVSLGVNHILPLGRTWTLVTIGSVGQLVGDAGDSPIVLEETQAFALTALTRSF